MILLEVSPDIPADASSEEEADAMKREVTETVAAFLRQKHKKEENGKEYFIDVRFQIWYRKRSPGQWGLFSMMIERLALADSISFNQMHRDIKWAYYPREGDPGKRLPKASSDLSTVEMARIIEVLIVECAERTPAVDIRDLWALWKDWRGKQDADPLDGDYDSEDSYRYRNPVCEACGRGLINDDAGREGQLAHIVPVSEGGADDDWNRLRLCTDCHILIQHDDGTLELIFRHSTVKAKVMSAWQRSGKSDIDTRLGRVKVHFQDKKEDELGIF